MVSTDIYEASARLARLAEEISKLEQQPLSVSPGEKISGAEMHFVVAVAVGQGRTATELAAALGITKGAASQFVKRLEASGYLERSGPAVDGKSRALGLTAKGRRIVAVHAELHGLTGGLFTELAGSYDQKSLRVIGRFLEDAERVVREINQRLQKREARLLAKGRGK